MEISGSSYKTYRQQLQERNNYRTLKKRKNRAMESIKDFYTVNFTKEKNVGLRNVKISSEVK